MHVIFHLVIFLLSFRNLAIILLFYLLASQIQLQVLLENKHFKLISHTFHSKKIFSQVMYFPGNKYNTVSWNKSSNF